LYRVRNILRAGQENLTDRQRPGLRPRSPPTNATSRSRSPGACAQQVRSAYHQDTHAAGKAIATQIVATLRRPARSRKSPASARRSRPGADEFLGYFDTGGASNGGTEAINGLIELAPPHRPRLPQPRQLPPTDAPHRRRATEPHPRSSVKSPITPCSWWLGNDAFTIGRPDLFNRWYENCSGSYPDSEDLSYYRDKGFYRQAVVIAHNYYDPRKANGPGSSSAIFLHYSPAGSYTAGCVGLTNYAELVNTLRWLNPDQNPVIVIR
jgi:hypothetical protein